MSEGVSQPPETDSGGGSADSDLSHVQSSRPTFCTIHKGLEQTGRARKYDCGICNSLNLRMKRRHRKPQSLPARDFVGMPLQVRLVTVRYYSSCPDGRASRSTWTLRLGLSDQPGSQCGGQPGLRGPGRREHSMRIAVGYGGPARGQAREL